MIDRPGSPQVPRRLPPTASDLLAVAEVLAAAGPLHVPVDIDRPVRMGWAPPSSEDSAQPRGGLLTDIGPGGQVRVLPIGPSAELPVCDLVVRAPEPVLVAALTRQPVDPQALVAVTVDDTGGGGRWQGPLPPFGRLAPTTTTGGLAQEAGGVRAQLLLTRSLLGGITCAVVVAADGQIDVVAGHGAPAAVHACLPYERYLRLCLGELAVADALGDGDIAGGPATVRTFAVLLGALAVADGRRRSRCGLTSLATCTAVLASEAYRRWVDPVRCWLSYPPSADSDPGGLSRRSLSDGAGDRRRPPPVSSGSLAVRACPSGPTR